MGKLKMKKIITRFCAVLLSASMIFMTGCMEGVTSDSQIDKGTSQAQEIKKSETTISESSESSKEESNNDLTADKELGIDYPRPNGTSTIKSGSQGDDVRWLQSALNKAMNAELTVDGSFGNGTESKVIEFQSRCGLSADGQVGPATIAMLVDILSGNKKMPEAPKVTAPPATKPPATQPPAVVQPPQQSGVTYVLNTNTGKFHFQSCSSVSQMSEGNKSYYTGTRDEVIAMGYEPCKRCNP